MSVPQRSGPRRLLPVKPVVPPRAHRILVVEEHPPMGELVQDVLSSAGYEVQVALGLAEAEALLTTAHFDLVLSDTLRKSTTGLLTDRWAPLERVRALAGHTPVVITTAYKPSFFGDYRERGFRDLLPKPFSIDTLLATVQRHLARQAS